MSELNVNPLAKSILRHLPEPGNKQTSIPGLTLYHIQELSSTRIPVVYRPCIYVVAQGSKSAYLGEEHFIYDELNFLVLSVPLPLQCMITQASKDKPYLALSINIDLAQLHDLIIEMALPITGKTNDGQRGIFVSDMQNSLLDCTLRLLKSMDQENDAKILSPMIRKEILYHVLCSEQGAQLCAFAHRERHNARIATVINHIQQHYAAPLEVNTLATLANMSTSSFHHYFKAVTNVAPLQYIKTMRLHEARKKMLLDKLTSSDACYEVGYSSPSQFSREYKRLFGTSPSKDIEQGNLAS